MPLSLRRRKRNLLLLNIAIVMAIVLFYILAQLGVGIPCLFHIFTGLKCPGCGNSRAAVALLQLDLPTALGYNLMFPLQFLYLLFVYIRCCASYWKGNGLSYHSPCLALDISILAATVFWGIIRNLL